MRLLLRGAFQGAENTEIRWTGIRNVVLWNQAGSHTIACGPNPAFCYARLSTCRLSQLWPHTEVTEWSLESLCCTKPETFTIWLFTKYCQPSVSSVDRLLGCMS